MTTTFAFKKMLKLSDIPGTLIFYSNSFAMASATFSGESGNL